VSERLELATEPQGDVLDDLGGLRVVAADLLDRDRFDVAAIALEDVGDSGPRLFGQDQIFTSSHRRLD
jgi:hypothetical protein